MASTPPGPFERCAPGSADHPILVLSRRARARGSIQAPSPLSAVATSRRGSGSDSSRSKLPLCVSRRLPASGRQISEDPTESRDVPALDMERATGRSSGGRRRKKYRRRNQTIQRRLRSTRPRHAHRPRRLRLRHGEHETGAERHRYEGYDACLRFWQELIDDPNGSFEPEDVVVSGDHATIRWRYRFGEGDENSVRGVTLMHARDRKIVEALGYVKAGLRP
jgi:hypothetical protein